ncbi:hypothetical protein [Abyssicoccus albus]|uniref:Uncharacterized protein n=1 Tax=Abyssicoccus albus TaxID=1817405 RepID=A0A3N5BGM2_9BACL|nr:hypothetical protein [Abyssicoccus albus]RPF56683.1 hypothetical protein EDD62_1337 [Abyssicoccus albus]
MQILILSLPIVLYPILYFTVYKPLKSVLKYSERINTILAITGVFIILVSFFLMKNHFEQSYLTMSGSQVFPYDFMSSVYQFLTILVPIGIFLSIVKIFMNFNDKNDTKKPFHIIENIILILGIIGMGIMLFLLYALSQAMGGGV